jgi:hypothetical protein
MTGNVSKYALIGGKEVTLLESISHASSGEVVCVFEDGSGARCLWQSARKREPVIGPHASLTGFHNQVSLKTSLKTE